MIGAYTGFLAAHDTPPLLLITVPFGILICASAMGLGQALEHGLRRRLNDLLRANDAQLRTDPSQSDAPALPRPD
jgi:hypothetical protein